MNPARENILARVRAALRSDTHRPQAPTESAIWPPIGDLESRFRTEFESLKGEILETADELDEFLKAFPMIATDGSEAVRRVVGPATATVREAALGVTGCDGLIAQTGTIVVSPRTAGGRLLSVLPAVHLVIARRDQILPDLASAMRLIRERYDGRWPSALSLITGPSRTADIEKILVMGAHGPKRLALYWTL